jgi:hypothetical protein
MVIKLKQLHTFGFIVHKSVGRIINVKFITEKLSVMVLFSQRVYFPYSHPVFQEFLCYSFSGN